MKHPLSNTIRANRAVMSARQTSSNRSSRDAAPTGTGIRFKYWQCIYISQIEYKLRIETCSKRLRMGYLNVQAFYCFAYRLFLRTGNPALLLRLCVSEGSKKKKHDWRCRQGKLACVSEHHWGVATKPPTLTTALAKRSYILYIHMVHTSCQPTPAAVSESRSFISAAHKWY